MRCSPDYAGQGSMLRRFHVVLVLLFCFGCDAAPSNAPARDDAPAAVDETRPVEQALSAALAAARAGADSVVDALRPVPLMTTAQENTLRRYDNAAHLARARALGARPASKAERERLVQAGRLVPLADSSSLYAVREMGRSSAFVTPGALALLEETGRRFQAALAERNIPPLRIEVTSALRTAEDQAALRRTNPNAAGGTSTHEFGTTMDIAYESFRAPLELPSAWVAMEPAWLRPHTELAARALLEAAANQKSRELTAILGDVLRRLQTEGAVYVTLERQQPVFHVTVAR